ncbi:unnamed protein product [Spirodela intermedia]|uniref:RING-type E3 ubiquitin transferase n=1 Tax=Spirodela intermedia TaxID=51605 RepID=A0A7I8LIH6_SPIIN|nr:unnamed protein product [Spirodela intermedia]
MGLRWRIYSGREESTLIDDVLILNESPLLGGRQSSQSPRFRQSPHEQSPDAADFMQMEEYMMIDSVYHNMHQDMHLDVDTMSYELLALEEQIGNVSMGLAEDTAEELEPTEISLFYTLQARILMYLPGSGGVDLWTCFPPSCVRKWLVQQNVCPLCKKMALSA